jgi:redox-sensitive bicupin YhaK (pirin superfamily)
MAIYDQQFIVIMTYLIRGMVNFENNNTNRGQCMSGEILTGAISHSRGVLHGS